LADRLVNKSAVLSPNQ